MNSIHDSGWTFSTIPALCARAAEIYGDTTAIEDGETRFTFTELDVMRRRVARAMIAAGIAKGDRVMIWAPNSWKWFVTALGIVSVGAVLVPVSTRFKGAEVGDLIERSGATAMFACGTFLGRYYPSQLDAAARRRLARLVVSAAGHGEDHDRCRHLAQELIPMHVDLRSAGHSASVPP